MDLGLDFLPGPFIFVANDLLEQEARILIGLLHIRPGDRDSGSRPIDHALSQLRMDHVFFNRGHCVSAPRPSREFSLPSRTIRKTRDFIRSITYQTRLAYSI